MKGSPPLQAALVIIVIGLIVATISLKSTLDELNSKNDQLAVDIEQIRAELAEKGDELELRIEQVDYLHTEVERLSKSQSELNASKNLLEGEKESLVEDNTQLEKKLNAIREEIDYTINDLVGYEEDITESMAWFRQNANLADFPEWSKLRQNIKGWCIERFEERCEMRISCITFVTDYLEEFHYKYDAETTGKVDFLQDLSELYESQGGDCEDYSLLAIASLNYMKDYCEEKHATDYRFVAFESEAGSKHWVEDTQKYYLDNSIDFDIPRKKQEYNIVCGTFPIQYDPNSATGVGKVGHCVIGFSEVVVESSDDVPDFLKSAMLVEPQNGRFLVDLSKPTVFHIPHDGEKKGDFPITIVITTEDLYMYEEFDGQNRWHGYADYVELIDGLKTELEEIR